MASSRKYYFHSKSNGPGPFRVSRPRTSTKSSDLFDQVINESSANSVIQPPALKSGRPWGLPSRESEMEEKKKSCDDKSKSRGGMVYNFSPFCPSPVKEPSSQATIVSSVTKETTVCTTDLQDEDKVIERMSIYPGSASDHLDNVRVIGMKENMKVFDFEDEEMVAGSSRSPNKPVVDLEKPTYKPTAVSKRYISVRGVARKGGRITAVPGRGIVKRTARIKEVSGGGGGGGVRSDSATDILGGVTATQDKLGIPLSTKPPPPLLGAKSKQDSWDANASAACSSNIRHGCSRVEDTNTHVSLASRDVTPPPIEVGVACCERNGMLAGCGIGRGTQNRKKERARVGQNKDGTVFRSDDPYAFIELESRKPIGDPNSKLVAKSGSGSKVVASGFTKPSVLATGSQSAITGSQSAITGSQSAITGSQSAITDSSTSEKMKPVSSQRKRLMETVPEIMSRKRSVDSDTDMLCQIDSMLEEHGNMKNGNATTRKADVKPSTNSSCFVHKSKVNRLKKSSSDFPKSKTRNYAYTTRPLTSSAGVSGERVPRMTKLLSWPYRQKKSRERSVVQCPKKVKKLVSPPMRSVHEAHQCIELGETRLFFEEVQYLLDNIKPCQPLQMRCLCTCNLASQCLEVEFSRQLRAHGYLSRIISLLKDCLRYPSLCLCAAVLLYTITRDKLCPELGEEGTSLLVGMLVTPHQPEAALEGKQARDMDKLKARARCILQKVEDQTSHEVDTPPPEDELDDEELLPLSQPTVAPEEVQRKGNKKEEFKVSTEEISVSELARECIISLSSPRNNPLLLRDQLRMQGALDHLANMVIASCDKLSAVDLKGLDDELGDQVKSTSRTVWELDRQLKSIENLTLMNPSNQSYLVVFDGSLLISKLTRFLRVAHQLLSCNSLRSCGLVCLLAVFKILLNLTHECELGSHRVGEQKDVMDYILRIILQCPDEVVEGDKFDISILALSLLINLTELSSANCRILESVRMDNLVSLEGEHTSTQHVTEDVEDVLCNGCVTTRGSSVRSLVHLFLQLNAKADSANIKVPTPQRLSQLSGTSPQTSSPSPSVTSTLGPQRTLTPEHCSRGGSSFSGSSSGHGGTSASCMTDLSGRLTDSVKGFSSPMDIERSQNWHHRSGPPTKVGDVSLGEEEDEECEPIEMDPLVFDREEFNCALDQAGRHMEDSFLSSYLALLLGNIASKDHDMVDLIRNLMPSQSFSEMIKALKQFVSFMSMAGSDIGLDSIRHTIKYLEALQPHAPTVVDECHGNIAHN